MLRRGNKLQKDYREKADGAPLRQFWDLPVLSTVPSTTNKPREDYSIYEAQLSIVVTGIDNWTWTAYGFCDTYFESHKSNNRKQSKDYSTVLDPLAACKIRAEPPLCSPRAYFLRVLEIRIHGIRREWNFICSRIEENVASYVSV